MSICRSLPRSPALHRAELHCAGLGRFAVPQALALSDIGTEIVYRPVSDVVLQHKIDAAAHVGGVPSFLAMEFIKMVRDEPPIQQGHPSKRNNQTMLSIFLTPKSDLISRRVAYRNEKLAVN